MEYTLQSACDNPFMLRRFAKQQEFLSQIKSTFPVPATLMELEANEIKGKESLLKIGEKLNKEPLKLADFEPKKVEVEYQVAHWTIPGNKSWYL